MDVFTCSSPTSNFGRRWLVLFLTLWSCFSSLIGLGSCAPQTKSLKWTVEYMYWSPDCEERVVMGINGMFPSPTIRARAGDTLEIEVINKLGTEGLFVHWHGIRQLGTPWADGVPSISHCPINPGESLSYKFVVDKPGTFFYHGHYGMQRSAGLYGLMIVDVPEGQKEPFQHDGELELLLSDWWHKSTLEQEVGLNHVPFRWIGDAQAILLNGRGQFNCSLAPNFGNSSSTPCNFKGDEQCAPPVLTVEPKKTYRLRLASSTALVSLNVAIANHKMTVVEADGNYVQPFEVDDLDIYSGESYSVLITANQDPNQNYWISVGMRGRLPKTPPALALLNYKGVPPLKLPTTPPPETPAWNDYNRSMSFSSKIIALNGSQPPPQTSNRRIMLLNTQNTLDGHYKWAINNISLSLPSTPYLGAIKLGLKGVYDEARPPEDFPQSYDVTQQSPNNSTNIGKGFYTIELNTTVDIILQNANALQPNVSEVHPWHLHGHEFWVLGFGQGRFTKEDEAKLNLKNPPYRNNAVVFPYGWTVIRFVPDNPGVWAFHCHIEPHLHMGMGVMFALAVDKVKGIPSNALNCGQISKVLLKSEFLD